MFVPNKFQIIYMYIFTKYRSIDDDNSVRNVMQHIDNAIQYGEDVEVNEIKDKTEE